MGTVGAPMDEQIYELNRKVDLLTAQVQYLSDQTRIAERARQERAELVRDLVPIANDAFRLTTEQLEEIQEYVDLGDLLHLIKRLLRNGRNFEAMLDQLESAMDMLQTIGPLTDSAFAKTVTMLAEAERKGYFVFAKGGMQIVDNVITSFTEDDVRQLGENIVLILRTVKEMTQPEVINLLRNTVQVIDVDKVGKLDTSLPSLLGQMRDPNFRRGLALGMRVLRSIGAQKPGVGHSVVQSEN
jgi:uncharacterized protein YjgD (DUF1641 family)